MAATDKLNFTIRPKGTTKKKNKKILNYRINGRDEIYIKVQGEDSERIFNGETEEIILGGKIIEPMLSYAINSWNVMLPYITYSFHKEQVEKYLESIKYAPTYEKEDI